MQGLPVSELLSLPVRMRGIELGRPVDVLLDLRGEQVVGLELLCGDGAFRFLPLTVAEIGDDEISVRSALPLIDERDLAYYRTRTRSLRELALDDPWLDPDGRVTCAPAAA